MAKMKRGNTGPRVPAWQAFLANQGFNPGPADGIFGVRTDQATRGYQQARGLIADGIVGKKTLRAAKADGFESGPGGGNEHGDNGEITTDVVRRVDGVAIRRLRSRQAVFYTSGMTVDADGCPLAYAPDDTGIELNAHARRSDGSFSPHVLVLDGNGDPVKQGSSDPAPGFFISKTAHADHSEPDRNPHKWVDALAIPYIVLPGGSAGAGGARAGDVALVIDTTTGKQVKAIVGDIGPSTKIGEASMFLAGRISGMEPGEITEQEARRSSSFISPRSGGTSQRKFRYIVFPRTRLNWPKSITAIEARVDLAFQNLNAAERDLILAGSGDPVVE